MRLDWRPSRKQYLAGLGILILVLGMVILVWLDILNGSLLTALIWVLAVLASIAVFRVCYYRLNWAWWTGFTGKKLWDWLRLLIVPAGLAGIAFLFNTLNASIQNQVSLDNQREAAFQAYVDKISELRLSKEQGTPENEIAIQSVARTKTLSVVRSLDGLRKGLLLRFLFESHLIDAPRPFIDLSSADFSGASIKSAALVNARLHGVNFTNADLSGTVLDNADLTEATLAGANLTKVDLSNADLSRANLDSAYLNESKLDNANLTNANLTKAEVSGEQLSRAKSLQGATLPLGVKATIPPTQIAIATPTQALATGTSLPTQTLRVTSTQVLTTGTPTELTRTPTSFFTGTLTATLVAPFCKFSIGSLAIQKTKTDIARLGCPREAEHTINYAIQRFDHGWMIDFLDNKKIYVLFDSPTKIWRPFQDSWLPSQDPDSCRDRALESGIKPIRGFGVVWCNLNKGDRDVLGAGAFPESGVSPTLYAQTFDNGVMFGGAPLNSQGQTQNQIFVLFNDQTWE